MELAFDPEILIMIPLTDIIEYPSEFDDNYFENRLFKKIREYLNIEIDICSIMEEIGYNRGRRENPSVSIYFSEDSFEKFILIDTYIGATDQLDLIDIGFSCIRKEGKRLREIVRQFYDETCKYNIYYCEGTNPIGYKYKNDFKKFEKLKKDKQICKVDGKKVRLYRGNDLLMEF